MRALLIILGVAVFSLMATGCNTISGIGKDVESVGGAVEEAAEDSK